MPIVIGLISAAALAYEVLLVRLFSIIQWHQFAFMIISVALLGYGAGGSFLSLWAARLETRFGAAFALQAALFGISTIPCFLAAQALHFNPLEALWDPGQGFRLGGIYLLLCLPFAFAACCIGLALGHYRERLHYVYACDLVGASCGAMGVMGLLYLVFPGTALKAVALLGLLAALIACRGLGSRWGVAALVLAIAGLLVLPEGCVRPEPLPYKGLPQALEILGTRVITERSSPLGILQVIESPEVPFRHAPGLSLNAPAEPPEQLGLFQDADGMSAITRYRGDRATLAYLDYLPSALPYHLLDRPTVLVLGAGGGAGVLQAVHHRARGIDAIELNPEIIALLREDFREYTGGILDRPEVRVHSADARGFVAGTSERFDLIELALLDAAGASAAGLQASSANYLYTVEALGAYLRRLTPGGILAITRTVTLPPRDGLKLFAMAVSALEAEREQEPARRLAWIRGFKTHTLLLRNGVFEAEDRTRIRDFCRDRSFDIAFLADASAAESDRYNRLGQPYFFEGAKALLGPERQDFVRRYKFDISPATDDRPYFFQFFKWPLLREAVAMRGAGGVSLLELGYPVILATLCQSVFLSAALILAPLGVRRWRGLIAGSGPGLPLRVVVVFGAIGLGFMFIEMAFIQKLGLTLGHPLLAVAVALSGFLVFAGLGSATMRREGRPTRLAMAWPIAGIVVLGVSYLVALSGIFAWTSSHGMWLKAALALLLIAPLGFCMGKPFPTALALLGHRAPALIPWAYGINACASVIGAVLAMLCAIHLGLSALLALALGCYLVALMAYSTMTRQAER